MKTPLMRRMMMMKAVLCQVTHRCSHTICQMMMQTWKKSSLSWVMSLYTKHLESSPTAAVASVSYIQDSNGRAYGGKGRGRGRGRGISRAHVPPLEKDCMKVLIGSPTTLPTRLEQIWASSGDIIYWHPSLGKRSRPLKI